MIYFLNLAWSLTWPFLTGNGTASLRTSLIRRDWKESTCIAQLCGRLDGAYFVMEFI